MEVAQWSLTLFNKLFHSKLFNGAALWPVHQTVVELDSLQVYIMCNNMKKNVVTELLTLTTYSSSSFNHDGEGSDYIAT